VQLDGDDLAVGMTGFPYGKAKPETRKSDSDTNFLIESFGAYTRCSKTGYEVSSLSIWEENQINFHHI
jgi:hypothetical protein